MTAPLRLPTPPRRSAGLMALLGFALLLFFFPPLVRLLAEWPWFTALGYERVYATRLIASALLGLVTGGFAFAFLYANLRFAQRGAVPNPVEVRMNPERPALDEQALRQLQGLLGGGGRD